MNKIYVVHNHGIDTDGNDYDYQIAAFDKKEYAVKTVEFLKNREKDCWSYYDYYELTICDKPIISEEEYNKIEFYC